jgi:WD40 repeat protein
MRLMETTGKGQEPRGGVAAFPGRAPRRGEAFYVVGGPVAPDRSCYIERGADLQLHAKLRAGEFCEVIAPRFSGKSSLVARVASRLRKEGVLTAVVDLSQLGSRDGSTEAGRWYYGLAYRVVRDLRLKIDLQAWWQDKMPLSQAQRLGEFFWEVVLGTTRGPVVVFLDEIDSVEQLDYAADLFHAVRACHDARATEPEYERLTFALLGTSLPGGAATRAGRGADEIARHVELADFRFEEARMLAAGLGLGPGDAERALYRILYWTGGHPYLTQKLCQAAARVPYRIESDEAVDRLVANRFFTRNAVVSESSLSRVRDVLERAGKLAAPALKLYRRIRRGRKVKHEPASPVQGLLKICGLARVTSDRCLVVRNRIYAEVFTTHWARDSLPTNWRRVRRLALAVLLILGVPYTYVEILPRPYEQTLNLRSVGYDEALAAWSGLRRIPGFAGRADDLLSGVLMRRSRAAETWPEAALVDAELRKLPDQGLLADRLLVEFWERRASDAEALERRDEALMYRLRAYSAGPTSDRGRLAELAGGDYERLESVIRPAGRVETVGLSPGASMVVTVTGGNVVDTWDAPSGLKDTAGRFQLVAEEFVTVRRRLSFDASGRSSTPRLVVAAEHPRPGDVAVVLISPSGRRAEFPLDSGRQAEGGWTFDGRTTAALAVFRGETVRGTWSLEIEDRVTGETGLLASWSLRLSGADGHALEDRPENPLLVPDPSATSAVHVALSPGGETVAALPVNEAARGTARAWRVADGSLLASLPLPAGPRRARFSDDRVLVIEQAGPEATRVLAWDTAAGVVTAELAATGALAAGPVTSPEGGFVAFAEAGASLIRVWSLADGRETARIAAAGEVARLALGAGGGLAAVADRNYVVRVWRSAENTLLAELAHDGPVLHMAFDPTGRWLATLDEEREIRVWPLDPPAVRPVLLRTADLPGEFGFASDGRRFAVHAPHRSYEVWSLPDAVPIGPVIRHGRALGDGPGAGGRLPMAADGRRLVTGAGSGTVRVWRLDEEGAPAALPRIAPVVALSPAGTQLAAGLADGRVTLRDPGRTAELPPVAGEQPRHGGPVTALAFSPDAGRVVSVGSDGSVLSWDVASRRQLGGLFHHGSGRVRDIDVGPDGRLLVTAGELGAKAWDAESGMPGVPLGPGRVVTAVALGPAGLRAFTGTPGGDVEAWDVATGERLWVAGLDGPADVLAVSADGRRIAAAGAGGQVRIWELFGTGVSRATRLPGPVIGLAFAPDGSALVAQTREWMHRLEEAGAGLAVVSSRLLPGSITPGAWRPASPDADSILMVGGQRPDELTTLVFRQPPAAPDGWDPDPAAWQRRLNLHVDDQGQVVPGPPPAPAEAPAGNAPLPAAADAAPDQGDS